MRAYNYLRRLLRPLTHPYRVLVIWEDAYTKHYALTYADALQWAACYPLDAFVLIRSRTGRVVGCRGCDA